MVQYKLQILISLVLISVFQVRAENAFQDPNQLETTAQGIERLLMAPCCWGSIIAEHSSPEAMEMKGGIRDMLNKGASDEEILSFYEKKYGERVLSFPKNAGFNRVAWIFPFIIFLLGTGLMSFFMIRRKEKSTTVRKPEKVVTTTDDQKYREQIDKELYGQA